MRARRLQRAGVLVLVSLGFLLRLAPLGRYVTPDEPAWVERSIRFADALASNDLGTMPSTGHPGVTTMWLGATGVVIRTWLSPADSAKHLDWIRRLAWLAPENGEAFRHLAFFLPFGRVLVALTTTIGLLATYWMMRRLFDGFAALATVGLLAFDPFLVGHSGLLHTDGLLATFAMLSVLSLLLAVRGGPGADKWAVLSGLTAGLALLTKSLGAYLVIFTVVVMGLSWFLGQVEAAHMLRWSALWGSAVSVTYVVLYPAMWVAPLDNIRDVLMAPAYQSTTALMPTYFLGQMALQHGPEFYAVALPFRLSPVVLIGLIVGVWILVTGKAPRRGLAWLGVFSLGYVLLLTLSVKRYQRYLLPVVGPLTAIATVSLLDIWSPRFKSRTLSPFIVIGIQLILLLPFVSHPLASLNPLLGGPWVGARLVSVDWGEGMGAAATWLNRRADATGLTVAASSVPSFASVFVGRTVPLEQAALADYVVREVLPASASSVDRPIAHTAKLGFVDHAVVLTTTAASEQAAYLADHAGPEDLILLDANTPLLRRYEGPGELFSMAPLPNEQTLGEWLRKKVDDRRAVWRVASTGASPITAVHLDRRLDDVATPTMTVTIADAALTRYVASGTRSANACAPHTATFGGQLILVDGVFPRKVMWPDDLGIALRWQAVGQPPVDYRALVILRDRSGHAWNSVESLVRNDVNFPTSAWVAGAWTDINYKLSLPPGIPPGQYTVEVSVYDGTTGARLGSTDPSGAFQGTRVPIGHVSVEPTGDSPDVTDFDISTWLRMAAGPLTLVGFDPPERRVISGGSLSFSLVWQADSRPAIDHQVRFRLVNSDDQVDHEVVRPLNRYPTSSWRAGNRFRSHYTLRVPPGLSSGSYHVTLNVVGESASLLWESSHPLAVVEVMPQKRSFTLPRRPSQLSELRFGGRIHLVGYDLPASETSPGGTLPLTLYWKADGPTNRSYTLFVHLLGPDGQLHGQVDRTPGDGASATSLWAAGQVIVDELTLPVAADATPGPHRIAVGFYDSAYGDRLTVVGGSDDLLPDSQAILPSEVIVTGD